MSFALSGFAFPSPRGFIPCLLRENFHGFCSQWFYIFITQRIYTVSPQRELSWIFPLVALYFLLSEDLYHVSSLRIFMDFALSGFTFSSLRGFVPCLPRENYDEFCPQWPFHLHHLEDLYHISSERIFMDFALRRFTFSSPRGFTPSHQRELSRTLP